jgi:hypothetical protein
MLRRERFIFKLGKSMGDKVFGYFAVPYDELLEPDELTCPIVRKIVV